MADVRLTLGRVPSPPDPRDFSIRALMRVDALHLPSRFISRSLGRSYRERFDQEGGSCVGHGHALLKIVEERRDARRHYDFDPYWIWHAAKVADGEGDPDADRGTYPRTAFDVLLKQGAALAGETEPESRFRIDSYYRLETIVDINAAIFALGPVIIACDWPTSWTAWPGPSDGKMPAPDEPAGGHEFVGYGFDDRIVLPWTGGTTRGGWRCANSWSTAFADHGDFWLPYAALDMNFEAWKALDHTTGKV